MEFDESKAIAAMRAHVGEDISALYDDDELLNLIDLIWDFYEENGLLEIDDDDNMDDEDAILDDLVAYATRMLRKDRLATIRPEHIRPLIEGEIAYEQELQ